MQRLAFAGAIACSERLAPKSSRLAHCATVTTEDWVSGMRTQSHHPANHSTSTWRCLRRTLPSARLDVLYCRHTPSVSRLPSFSTQSLPCAAHGSQRYVTSTHARARSDRKVYFDVLCCAFTKPFHRAWHTSACSPRHYSQPVSGRSGRAGAGPGQCRPSARSLTAVHCRRLPTDRLTRSTEVTAAEPAFVRAQPNARIRSGGSGTARSPLWSSAPKAKYAQHGCGFNRDGTATRSYSARCSPDAPPHATSRRSSIAAPIQHSPCSCSKAQRPALAGLERRTSFGRVGFGSSAYARRLRLRRALMQRERPNDRVVHRRAARRERWTDALRTTGATSLVAFRFVLNRSDAHAMLQQCDRQRRSNSHCFTHRRTACSPRNFHFGAIAPSMLFPSGSDHSGVVALYLKTDSVRSGCANAQAVAAVGSRRRYALLAIA